MLLRSLFRKAAVCLKITLLLSFFSFLSSANEIASTLKPLMDIYQKETDHIRTRISTGNLTDEELTSFRKRWYNTLSAAVATNQQDSYYVSAVGELEGLANVLKNYDSSQYWVNIMLQLTNSPQWQFHWNSELGEVLRQRFLATGDERFAREAIKAFENATNFFRSAATFDDPIAKGQNMADLAYLGEIESKRGNFKNATIAYQSAESVLRDLSDSERDRLAGFDDELFAGSILQCAAHTKDTNIANEAFTTLSGLKGPRLGASYYGFIYAQERWPEDMVSQLAFIGNWLDHRAPDKWTSFLRLEYGCALVEAGKSQEALTNFNILLKENVEDLKAQDAKDGLTNQAGNYARLLLSAARAEFDLGNRTRGEELKKELLQSFSDSGVRKLAAFVTAPPANNLLYPPPKRTKYLTLIAAAFLVINFALFWLALRIRRKKGRKPSSS